MQARKTIGSTVGGHLRGPGHAYVLITIHAVWHGAIYMPTQRTLKHLTAHLGNAAPHFTISPGVGLPISHPPHAAHREPAHFYLPSEMKVAWRILIANPEKRVSSKGFQSALGEECGHAAPTQGRLKWNYCYSHPPTAPFLPPARLQFTAHAQFSIMPPSASTSLINGACGGHPSSGVSHKCQTSYVHPGHSQVQLKQIPVK